MAEVVLLVGMSLLSKLGIHLVFRRHGIVEFDTDRVDTMSFIGRMAIPFALEHMAQMSPAIRARDLSSDSSKAAVLVSTDSSWKRIEESGPPTTTIELVVIPV